MLHPGLNSASGEGRIAGGGMDEPRELLVGKPVDRIMRLPPVAERDYPGFPKEPRWFLATPRGSRAVRVRVVQRARLLGTHSNKKVRRSNLR